MIPCFQHDSANIQKAKNPWRNGFQSLALEELDSSAQSTITAHLWVELDDDFEPGLQTPVANLCKAPVIKKIANPCFQDPDDCRFFLAGQRMLLQSTNAYGSLMTYWLFGCSHTFDHVVHISKCSNRAQYNEELSQCWFFLLGYNILKNTNVQYRFQYRREEFITSEGIFFRFLLHTRIYEAFNKTQRHNFTWVASDSRMRTDY